MSLSILKDCSFFEYLGLVVFSYAVLKVCYKIFNNLGTFYLGQGSVNLLKYGKWAVVTGCTDGIGKAYAEQLAKRGLNIVLISRTLEKLQVQAKELSEKYKIETKIIAVDFTDPINIYPEIKKQLADLEIGVLVNNVGVGYKYPEYFDAFAQDDKTVTDMINCNITSVTKMTGIVLPGMVQRKKGVIINNASGSGRLPTPLLSVYSASKAYVDFFARALDVEYKSKGIIVQSLCPYFVSTKLSAVRRSLTAPKPDEFVSSALKTIGSQSVTNGCLIHNIQGWVLESLIPRFLLDNLMMKQMLVSRKKAIAKANRLQAQDMQKKD